MWKMSLFCIWLGLTIGCARQAEKPITEQIETQALSFTVILEGYRSGDERRAFQEILKTMPAHIENLNAGGQHAEYAVTPHDEKSDWLTQLRSRLEPEYTFRQEGNRLYFVRKP